MKVHVVVDKQGNIMGALTKGEPSPEGDEVVIAPAQQDHRLLELEVPEDELDLPVEEFHKRLKSRSGKK